MITRADRYTQRSAVDETYSDLPITFDRNPVTGNLSRVTNEEAVKGSIRQIVLAMAGEWPHHPFLGSDVYRKLFEPIDLMTAKGIEDSIRAALRNNENRAMMVRCDVVPVPQEDGYRVTIWFRLVNTTDEHSVTEFLKRLR